MSKLNIKQDKKFHFLLFTYKQRVYVSRDINNRLFMSLIKVISMRKLSIYKSLSQHTPFPFYQSSMYYLFPEYLLVNEKQDIQEPHLMAIVNALCSIQDTTQHYIELFVIRIRKGEYCTIIIHQLKYSSYLE